MERDRKAFRFAALMAIGLFLLGSSLAGQDVPDSEVVHPYQRVVVPNLAVVTTRDGSSSAVVKAAVAIVLSASKTQCDPHSQLEDVLDANADSPLRILTEKISGASCTVDGRTLRVAASFIPNGAIQGNNIIASVMERKPMLVEWKHALYVLYGVVYDEHLHASGRRDNVIRELLLIDPHYSDKRRFVAFERERHNFSDLEGIATVTVSE